MKKFILLFLLFNTSIHAYADKIAIIGGGASGLVSAFLLEQDHEVTLYESTNKLGGHINTVPIIVDGEKILIENGAEFFNEISYPHFLRLLRYLTIPVKSYTLVTNFYTTDNKESIIFPPYHDGIVEKTSLTPSNLQRLIQLRKVINKGRILLESHNMAPLLSEFVDTIKLSSEFKNDFLFPFLASAWGVSPEEMKFTSAYISLKYVIEGNDANNYKWYEIEKGLSSYIEAVHSSLKTTKINLNSPIKSIRRENERYVLSTQSGKQLVYDHVIFSTNATVTAKLLKNVPDVQDITTIFKNVRYYETKVAIHGDARFMPANKKDWRVVNIAYNGRYAATTIYKKWKSKTPIFRSWITFDVRSPGESVPEHLYAISSYQHPHTDHFYIEAQQAVRKIQGYRNLWFVGVWTRDNDSHESALVSAVKVAEQLAPNSKRLKIIKGNIKLKNAA